METICNHNGAPSLVNTYVLAKKAPHMDSFEDRKLAVIRVLERVASGGYGFTQDRRENGKKTGAKWHAQPFISPNSIDEQLPPVASEERSAAEVRNAAMADSDDQDQAAGRPLLTSVVIDGVAMMPTRKSYFSAIEKRDKVTLKTDEDKWVAFKREHERAMAYPWATVDRG